MLRTSSYIPALSSAQGELCLSSWIQAMAGCRVTLPPWIKESSPAEHSDFSFSVETWVQPGIVPRPEGIFWIFQLRCSLTISSMNKVSSWHCMSKKGVNVQGKINLIFLRRVKLIDWIEGIMTFGVSSLLPVITQRSKLMKVKG